MVRKGRNTRIESYFGNKNWNPQSYAWNGFGFLGMLNIRKGVYPMTDPCDWYTDLENPLKNQPFM